jgi:S-formylglutathione hydrolase FrmB
MKQRFIIGFIGLFGFLSLVLGMAGCGKDSPLPPDPEPVPFVRLLEEQSVQSTFLNRDMRYAVLLPKEYEDSTKRFPVVYLLHGYGETETGWYKGGQAQFYIDQNEATTVPMIYVMPQGFNTYYVNKYNGNYRYMDFFIEELVPAIDSLFRTIPDAQNRAVMGYSMGGYGAMILPMKNPTVFKTGVVLSMSFRTDEQYLAEPQYIFDGQWGTIFGGTGTSGTARLTDYFKDYSPFHFLGTASDSSFEDLNLFIDCGDDEETLSVTNDAFHDTLRSLNIEHEYRMRNGAHTWSYWHSALPEALKFISLAVQQLPYPADPDPVDPGLPVPAERLVSEELPDTGITFSVALPSTYLAGTALFPLIIFVHDRSSGAENEESQNLFSLLNSNMISSKLPESLVVEIPLQENLTHEILQQIIALVKEKYRTTNDRNQTVIAGNKQAGALVWELAPGFSGDINACLLFDAGLSVNASAENPEIAYYLDINDDGENYKGYHSLYLSLRENEVPHEYRVRQGRPSHQTFLNGINASAGFMKDHLN